MKPRRESFTKLLVSPSIFRWSGIRDPWHRKAQFHGHFVQNIASQYYSASLLGFIEYSAACIQVWSAWVSIGISSFKKLFLHFKKHNLKIEICETPIVVLFTFHGPLCATHTSAINTLTISVSDFIWIKYARSLKTRKVFILWMQEAAMCGSEVRVVRILRLSKLEFRLHGVFQLKLLP